MQLGSGRRRGRINRGACGRLRVDLRRTQWYLKRASQQLWRKAGERNSIGISSSGIIQTSRGRRGYNQADKSSNACVTTCPKEHNRLTDMQLPVVAHTYFGVGQQCLVGLIGLHIRLKARRGKEFRETECDAYGENLVKATLP